MGAIAKVQNITASSLAHIDLLDEFIDITQTRMAAQHDGFVRESLGELLESLRQERQGYAALLDSLPFTILPAA